MEVISKPLSVRGLGNVIDLHGVEDYALKEDASLTVDSDNPCKYQVLILERGFYEFYY